MLSSKPIRVCHLASGDLWAGAEVQVATVLSSLVKQSDLEISAVVLNYGKLAQELRKCGVHVTVIDENNTGSLGILKKLRRLFKDKKIDILHTHRYKENILGGLAAELSGIRHIVSWHQDRFYSMTDRPDYLTDPDWQRGYALLDKFRMSFDLQIFPHQLADSAVLAEKFPAIPLIIEHCALPMERDPDGMERWRKGMRRMAELPNTVVKLSALTLLDHKWTQASLSPIIREAIEIFSPDRTMFGSDFPIEKIHIQYGQWVDVVAGAISDLTDDEQDAIFYRTANRIYRL